MTTRNDVLAALRSAGDAGLSGEAIARSLGVSRVAVSKHVATLREIGYTVSARPGVGYVLEQAPDLAIAEEVGPLLTHPLWVRVTGSVETGSTNDDARAMAAAGAPEGAVVIAARQSQGRGRLGRTWESPDGGAYVSAVLRPVVAPAEAGALALVVAVGAARGLERLGVSPLIKWPNDLLLDGGKLSGVLLEMSAEGDRVDWVVAGVGLNVRRQGRGLEGASYLSDRLPTVRAAVAAAAALDGIAEAYEQWRAHGFESLAGEYESRSALTGRDVVVRDAAGNPRATGIVAGIDRDGRLLVSGADGTIAVAAGEVTLRPLSA